MLPLFALAAVLHASALLYPLVGLFGALAFWSIVGFVALLISTKEDMMTPRRVRWLFFTMAGPLTWVLVGAILIFCKGSAIRD